MKPAVFSDARFYWVLMTTLFFAMVLSVIPVPQLVFDLWPDWVPLLLFYWALMAPERVGAWTGLIVGILAEVIMVKSFGVYALGLASLVYFVGRIHQQIRVLPMWQQMLLVAFFVGFFKLVTGWLYGLIDGYVIRFDSYYSLIGNALVWPFLYILLQEFTRSVRAR